MEVFANTEKKLNLEERNLRFHYHALALLNSEYIFQIRNITNMLLGCWLSELRFNHSTQMHTHGPTLHRYGRIKLAILYSIKLKIGRFF